MHIINTTIRFYAWLGVPSSRETGACLQPIEIDTAVILLSGRALCLFIIIYAALAATRGAFFSALTYAYILEFPDKL